MAFNFEEAPSTPTNESITHTKKGIDITIEWNKAIAVPNLYFDMLNDDETAIAKIKRIVYIFVGYDKYGNKAYDVGQTGDSLKERVEQHVTKGDYLEGYPQKQIVYCGRVIYRDNRDLLEQVEGAFIQYMSNKGVNLCNRSKLKNYTRHYDINQIINKSLPTELVNVVSRSFKPC